MTEGDPIPRAVREQAAHWFALREAGDLSPTQAARLDAWLAETTVNRRAFAKAGQVWAALGPAMFAGEAPAPPRPIAGRPDRPGRWRRWAGGAVAACLALGLAVQADIPTRLSADAATAWGEQRRVALPDGSTVLLNTDSAIAIDSADGRSLRLLKGEAAFTVAPDRAHPFSVRTQGGTTTALGTRFLVREAGDGADVAVTEHSVRVATAAGSRIVHAGEALSYRGARLGAGHRVEIADVDAWTRGRIRVVDRPLGDVVRELNRYHRGYIGIWNADLARRPVSGTFDLADPVGALDVIQQTLGLASTRLTDRIIILHR